MKKENTHMIHYVRGQGRPQILLVGNGLEMESGQQSWGNFIEALAIDDCVAVSDELRATIPFPLLYEIVTTEYPAPAHFSEETRTKETENLKNALKQLRDSSNRNLDMLPSVGADHIFTTNYSYCVENAFLPNEDFNNEKVRKKYRFNASASKTKSGKQTSEPVYKMHSGYCIAAADGKKVGIWHIHGQKALPESVVLGHDKYGSNLSRIETAFSNGFHRDDECEKVEFRSWPELFTYGDVYILGFGFAECETDLWWLLRKRQRVDNSDGRVYFYSPNSTSDGRNCTKLLLKIHGVEKSADLPSLKAKKFYHDFYVKAIEDIKEKISASRQYEEERSCVTCP